MKILPVILLLFAFVALAFAQVFSCPSGSVENLECAAYCCEMNGGSYTYSDETCTTETHSQLEAAFRCEADNGCCEHYDNYDTDIPIRGGGCCGAFILLALGAVPLLVMRSS